MEPELLLAATIGAPNSLKGDVSLTLDTDRPEEVFAPGALVHTDGNPKVLTVKRNRYQGRRFLVAFDEASDRTAAEALVGLKLLVEPSVEDDAWYSHDLQGLPVLDEDGTQIGTAGGLQAGPAHDYLVVDVDGTQALIPFVTEMVPTVDVEARRIVVTPPDGLLPTGRGADELDA